LRNLVVNKRKIAGDEKAKRNRRLLILPCGIWMLAEVELEDEWREK
jgi:hypothetical protein